MTTPSDDAHDRDELARRRRERHGQNTQHVHAFLAPASERDVLSVVDLVDAAIRRPLTHDEMRAAGIYFDPAEDDPFPPERHLTLTELEAVIAAVKRGCRTLAEVVDAVRAGAPRLADELALFAEDKPSTDSTEGE